MAHLSIHIKKIRFIDKIREKIEVFNLNITRVYKRLEGDRKLIKRRKGIKHWTQISFYNE